MGSTPILGSISSGWGLLADEPEFKDDPLYRLLREGRIDEFNQRYAAGERVELEGSDLRGVDLKGVRAKGISLANCYLRNADLRGLDLRGSDLEGASIHGARISGCYFPEQLTANEIALSHELGTRMRYRG